MNQNKKENAKNKHSEKPSVSKTAGVIIRVGRRDFIYDKVKEVTRYAPVIDVALNHLTVFNEFMAEGAQLPPSNPVDDGAIRILRLTQDVYEVVSGKAQIAAAVFEYKKAIIAAGELEENRGKTVGELVKKPLIKARLTSWKYLNPCEVPPKKLDAEELKSSLAKLSETMNIKVKERKPAVGMSATELGNAMNGVAKPAAKPRAAAESSGKFGRIFGGAGQ